MMHLAGLCSCYIVCGWVLKWISSSKTKTMQQAREKILRVNDWCVFLLPPSWFLVCPWWQKGLPNLQESTEHDPRSTTVWLLQQNWKTYCKPLRTHATECNWIFSFSTKKKNSEFTPALCVRSKKYQETSRSLTWPLMMSCSWIPGTR